MDEVLERELKWDVDEHFAVPRLDDIVAGSDVEHSTVTLNSACYDTADGDLQTHGVLLRRRDGDDDTGWQLKVPDAEGRVEFRTGLSDTPPSELTDALTGMRLGKPLVNVATIRTTRDRYRITDPRRHRLCAEVADDHVLASIDDRLLAWREIEVELGPAARSMPRRLTKRLIEAGAKPGRYPSKLARVSPTTRPEAAGGTAAGRAVASYLTEQIDNIFDGDLGLRRGSDPVHDTRVAIRRLRSTVRVFGKLWTGRPSDTSTTTSSGTPGCSERCAIVRCNAAASRRRWTNCRPSSFSDRSPAGSTPICSQYSCERARSWGRPWTRSDTSACLRRCSGGAPSRR